MINIDKKIQELLKENADLKNQIKSLKRNKKYWIVRETWKDNIEKQEKVVLQCQNELPILENIEKNKVTTKWVFTNNILIEWDNYHSLSILSYTHKWIIDMIYIDPPYNTWSKDFFYNDSYVDKEDEYKHSKWLNFMSVRLRLAKDLLSKNWVAFISIDDNEFAKLKMLCDEIFWEDKVDVMIWRKSWDSRDWKMKNTTTFRKDHEYIIICFKNIKKLNKLSEVPNFQNDYDNPDNDPRWPYKAGSISRTEVASNPKHKNYYTVISPAWKKFKRQFDIPYELFMELHKDNRIYWWKKWDAVPSLKIFIFEQRFITPYSILLNKGTTTDWTKELNDILKWDYSFMRPKPISLIKTLIQLWTKKNSIILDFFAWSWTTWHATMLLNSEDGWNRQYILCTNNEWNICSNVCYPRIKKIIEWYTDTGNKKVNWLKGNLKYYKTAFVENKSTDRARRELVKKSTDMLCLAEWTFDLIEKSDLERCIFENKEKIVAIIYDDTTINSCVSKLNKQEKPITIYQFSYNNEVDIEPYKKLTSTYQTKAIPDVLLKAYQNVFNKTFKILNNR